MLYFVKLIFTIYMHILISDVLYISYCVHHKSFNCTELNDVLRFWFVFVLISFLTRYAHSNNSNCSEGCKMKGPLSWSHFPHFHRSRPLKLFVNKYIYKRTQCNFNWFNLYILPIIIYNIKHTKWSFSRY